MLPSTVTNSTELTASHIAIASTEIPDKVTDIEAMLDKFFSIEKGQVAPEGFRLDNSIHVRQNKPTIPVGRQDTLCSVAFSQSLPASLNPGANWRKGKWEIVAVLFVIEGKDLPIDILKSNVWNETFDIPCRSYNLSVTSNEETEVIRLENGGPLR